MRGSAVAGYEAGPLVHRRSNIEAKRHRCVIVGGDEGDILCLVPLLLGGLDVEPVAGVCRDSGDLPAMTGVAVGAQAPDGMRFADICA
ncbi:hypothetical protein GCM10022252_60090 [Streptosporangium oxazolinicum]|uniref:Uncharacterized protein n=1 Tax=Streptosporangium oxazolinicum TaxID=909287 RepID=A0ABP8BCG8_9ACTN